MEWILIYGIIIYAVASAGICLVQRFDDPSWKTTLVEKGVLLMFSSVNGVILWSISQSGRIKVTEITYLALFAGCLLFACVTDSKKYVVFQFTWWAAAVILGVWFMGKNVWNGCTPVKIQPDSSTPSGLFVYILIQEFFFSGMYGRADCHGFVLCGMAQYLCGINMSGYVYHMAIAFGLLGAVQLLRRNVNHKGNLKQSVAFLPYITLAFWVWLYIAFFPK